MKIYLLLLFFINDPKESGKYLIENGILLYEIEKLENLIVRNRTKQFSNGKFNYIVQFWNYGLNEIYIFPPNDSLKSVYKFDSTQIVLNNNAQVYNSKRSISVFPEYFVLNKKSILYNGAKFDKERVTNYLGRKCIEYVHTSITIPNGQLEGSIIFYKNIPVKLVINFNRKITFKYICTNLNQLD